MSRQQGFYSNFISENQLDFPFIFHLNENLRKYDKFKINMRKNHQNFKILIT